MHKCTLLQPKEHAIINKLPFNSLSLLPPPFSSLLYSIFLPFPPPNIFIQFSFFFNWGQIQYFAYTSVWILYFFPSISAYILCLSATFKMPLECHDYLKIQVLNICLMLSQS